MTSDTAENSPPPPPAPAPPSRRSPGRHARWRWAALVVLACAGAVMLWLTLRPAPRPDFAAAPVDDLLAYSLLEEDFNRLPVEERLDLLRTLLDRFKNMSGDDSALMAP